MIDEWKKWDLNNMNLIIIVNIIVLLAFCVFLYFLKTKEVKFSNRVFIALALCILLGVGLLISVGSLIDMGRTALNVSGSMTSGVLASRAVQELDTEVYNESADAKPLV